MTDRELMQMALDTFNDLHNNVSGYTELWRGAFDREIALLERRLAQPEPEPVIKMKELLEVQGRDGNWNLDQYMQGMYNGMELMVALAEGRDPVFRKAPENWLSAPPQRNWQGLTNEEIEDIRLEYHYADGAVKVGYERAIEAKLKEKNT
jgi:hypothetical protein